MKKQFTLDIDKPCHEDWDKMSKNQQGRFCLNCNQTVIDFTDKSEAEIISIIENSSKSICGRMDESQINKVYHPKTEYRYLLPIRRIANILLLIATKITLSSYNILTTKPYVKTEITQDYGQDSLTKNEEIKYHIIKGIMIEKTSHEPIMNGFIRIENTKCGIKTDTNGNFELKVPDSLYTDNVVLEGRSLGFKQNTKSFRKEDLNHEIVIYFKLKMNTKTMGLIINKTVEI